MEQGIEITSKTSSEKMYLAYALSILCLFDWVYKLFQLIIRADVLSVAYYFAHLFDLWRASPIVTTLVLIICVVGIPKFLSSLRKSFDVLKRLAKSIMKAPMIINVPMGIYFFILILKFSLLASTFLGQNDLDQMVSTTPVQKGYWKEIRRSLTLYRYSTLTTIVLFLLGVYSAVTNRLTYRISKQILSISTKQIKAIQGFLLRPVPTPISLIILLFLNLTIRLFPRVSLGVYRFVTNRSVIYLGIVLIALYRFYRWFWPRSKFNLDFSGDINLNDVSRLNETRVYSLFYPRTINDIEYLIAQAKSQGRTISLRGQAHTMGGQTLPSRTGKGKNYVCDLKYLNRVEYDQSSKEVLVEAGATWTHVIKKLNFYGRSPVVMQSYCTFSVAGTISVNAHGITSDDAMYESVISIEYLDVNGKRGECSREKDPELFSLMIGGYGLFGIITRLRLKTVSNVKTSLEYIRLQSDQFSRYYEEFLNDSTIEIKIARVDLVRPNNILMFVFRQESGTSGTVADLSDEARVMHPRQHLIYTYLAQHGLFRRVRFALEKVAARPLDLTYSTDRNTTMYESAKPMALLYQPLTYYDDTFVLQEYFIPKDNFHRWYVPLQAILRTKYEHVFLLNLTIRFVKKDQLTYLAYTKRGDCYAFVFYFRIKRNEMGDDEVRSIHQKLIELTFRCQGTFYLPYRQHYSYEQILQAYPMFETFFEKKLSYDSMGLFSNDWYEHYRPKKEMTMTPHPSNAVEIVTEKFQIVEQRRMNSFFMVITNEILREKFHKFLRTVFNAEPAHVIFNYVNRAVRNPANKDDHDIYRELQDVLKNRQFAFIRQLVALFKQIRQLRIQIADMLRQQITIFKHLGYVGKIKDIASFGDGGRCLNELRQILQIKDGRVYVLNESERWTDMIERNSFFPIGTFIPYKFSQITDVPIPGESVDLVVCYMGLHHLPQDQLEIYLKMIHRILRPNGLFLFREHHAYEELKPLLDVAHMVFNVVTGVDYDSEVKEIRAFRTVEQWRSCLREAGFVDTFIYDEQEDDPTDDIMIVVRKPLDEKINANEDLNEIIENGIYDRLVAIPESNYFRPCEWFVVRTCMQFGQYLNHTPFHKFPYLKFLIYYWSLFYIETDAVAKKFGIKAALVASPGFIMNGFIGILMSVAFLQMAFISSLILTFSGETKPEYEQLVVEQTEQIDHNNFNFQQSIDDRIDNIQILKEKSCYAIRTPRHHLYTAILKKLALHPAKFNLLRISNLDGQIQIEMTVNNNDQQRLLWLKQHSNIHLLFEYKNPIDMNKTHLILAVKIKHLFAFLRDCANFEIDQSLTIIQIFDHFDWYLPE